MTITLFQGYPDYVGRRFLLAGNAAGPTSYQQSTGDPVNSPGFQVYLDAPLTNGVLTVSGNYYVVYQPSGAGPRATWKAIWYDAATFTQVPSNTNLSAETLPVAFLGGKY
jgi:hypothetical protein